MENVPTYKNNRKKAKILNKECWRIMQKTRTSKKIFINHQNNSDAPVVANINQVTLTFRYFWLHAATPQKITSVINKVCQKWSAATAYETPAYILTEVTDVIAEPLSCDAV